jgi:hypothetical protein
MKKRRRPLGRPLLHARALCDHGVVWSTEAIYLLGSTAGVPEGRSAALIYAGAPV